MRGSLGSMGGGVGGAFISVLGLTIIKSVRVSAPFESFPPSGVPKGERSEAESRNLLFNRFLHFGPLRGPPVEMTKAHILIIIGIIESYRLTSCHS